MSALDFDDVLKHLNEWGPYQKVLFSMLCIPACLPAAFLAFNQVFLSAEPKHWCSQPEISRINPNLSWNEVLNLGAPLEREEGDYRLYSRCSMYQPNWTQVLIENGNELPQNPDTNWTVVECQHGWEYDKSEFVNTLVTELDLVCDQQWWPSTSTALFYVGSLIGNIVFGQIADRYGRRCAFFVMLFMAVSLSVGIAFSTNYIVYTILRTINGLTFPQLFQIPFILCLEVMGPAYRTGAGMMLCMFFAVALMILSVLSYFFNSWFQLALITSLPFTLLLGYWWFVPESPRWLLSTGRIDEAEVVVQKIAKWNKKDIPANFVHQLANQTKSLSSRHNSLGKNDEMEKFILDKEFKDTESEKTKHCSILTLIQHYPIGRRNFLLITFNWLANAMVYNGLSYYSANLNVSSHLGFFISSAVEVPSYFIGWYYMDKCGRRWILFATMMIGGVSCISCMFVPVDADPWWTVGLAMIGKFNIALSFAVIYVYAGELMPTVVRSQAMGISSFVAGIGLLVFPYINSLGSINRILPLVIMGTFSCLGGITALFLPETLWRHLPNTLAEGEGFGSVSWSYILTCPQKSDTDDTLEAVDKIAVQQTDNQTEATAL